MISIVVTNYNYASFLRSAIDSALSQTDSDCEVIVVDDGSTDNSREIIRGYGNQILPILKQNGGQASAFNAGFAQCRGNAVIFLDADDVLLPDTARRVAQVIDSHANVAKVQYRMEVIDAQGNRTGIIKPATHLPLLSGDLRQFVINFPDDLTWMATSGNAFATSALRQIFPIPESDYGAVGADWYVSHLTPLFGQVRSLDYVGAGYRVHGSNSYELDSTVIDLAHIRQTILYSQTTHRYIKKFANQLGLDTKTDIISVAYIANRIISLRLDSARHPITGDTPSKLFVLGLNASLRRFDISPVMKLMFIICFAMMAVAPKFIAQWLAVKFMFPEARALLNRWLGALHLTR